MWIAIQVIWGGLAVIQALHNYYSYYIDDYKNPLYGKYNQNYHKYQLIREIGITLVVSILLGNYISFFILMLIRFIFFQYSINLISKNSLWYLSNRGTDKLLKDILGIHASKIILGLSILGVIILNLL